MDAQSLPASVFSSLHARFRVSALRWLVPCSLALLNHACPEDRERTHAIGIWAAGASVTLTAGSVIGGILIATIGWRSIFFINLPLGLLGIWLTWRYVDETTRTQRRLDCFGQILAIAALGSLAGAAIEAGARDWTNIGVLAGLALSLCSRIRVG